MGAELIDSNLCGANFEEADLSGANLKRANLVESKLRKTILTKAILTDANLVLAVISETIFADIDLSEVKGLRRLRSNGPSIVDHQTLMQSKNLPEKFLRDCGLPDQFIEYLPSLLNSLEPLQFYSCFISHSAKDEEFAQRLYADLQAKGIRCWYAPENLKIGDEISPTLDKAIRVHEKLLLIFSENSISSAWVRKEANEAMATEEETGKKNVLFPIRLDDSIMDTTEQWCSDVKRERHIGDFRNWKDHDVYQKSFAPLLRDLGKV
ncbi:MAG: toll/interleukin-1 receptor domain-containing protein [Nitrospinae bacterium]|nr:toll/interleukin-1 receptor domain-containing protein [Nitrospinota bacterium]MBL7019745.1 toll/interleukin-1 receptor domain-containing protein [Nitrospinaceae bacterium]